MLGKKQFRILRDWFAWVYQHPGEKPGWTPVIVGPQGIGKDWLLTPFWQALGPHNIAYIEFSDAAQRFNAYSAIRQFVIMNEARKNNPTKAKESYNRIKTITSSLPPTRRVEEKHIPAWEVKNIQAGIVLTNFDDAIALEHGEPRFCVFNSIHDERPTNFQEFFEPHFAWCPRDDEKGEAAYQGRVLAGAQLAAYLSQIDLSKFRQEEAPATEAKQVMLDAANPQIVWLDDQFSEGGEYEGRSVVVINDLLGRWNYLGSRRDGEELTAGAVKVKLRSLNYTPYKDQVRINKDTRIRPWLSEKAVKDRFDKSIKKIKAAYENGPNKPLTPGSTIHDTICDPIVAQAVQQEAARLVGRFMQQARQRAWDLKTLEELYGAGYGGGTAKPFNPQQDPQQPK
jgi:hypothetical protein